MTLTLPERIRWLHGPDGPRGKLSHDRFGEALGGIKRGRIIAWEKAGGTEPEESARLALSSFSGFPPEAFSRRRAEAPAAATIRSRLQELAETLVLGFVALGVDPDRLRTNEGDQSPEEGAV